MRITYSRDADVLYVSFSPPKGSVASVENSNGDILRIDKSSGEIIGVTIQLFMYRICKGEKIEVPEVDFSISNPTLSSFVESRLQ
jgi:uncharacterized protein YuzE